MNIPKSLYDMRKVSSGYNTPVRFCNKTVYIRRDRRKDSVYLPSLYEESFFSVDFQCLIRTFEKKTGNAFFIFTIPQKILACTLSANPLIQKKRKGISRVISEGVEALSTNRKHPFA